MAADLVINIVEGAQGGQPPTPPAMPAPAPAPPAFVEPPPPVGVPDFSLPSSPGGRVPRASQEEREALDEARKANRHLDSMAAGIVGIGRQLIDGIRFPSIGRLITIGESIVTILLGQRVQDVAREGIRAILPRASAPPARVPVPPPIITPPMPVPPPVVGAAGAGAVGAGAAGATGAGAAGAGVVGAGTAGAAGAGAVGLSAFGGPVGIAVGVAVVALGAAAIGAAVALRSWSSAMQQSIQELAQYSGVLSAQRGIQQFEMTLLEMERARRLEDPLSRMQARGDRLERLQYEAMTELLALGAALFKVVEPFAENFVDFAELTVKILAKIVTFTEAYMLVLSKGFGGLPKEIQEFIIKVQVVAQFWLGEFGGEPPKENLRDRMIDMLEGLARG